MLGGTVFIGRTINDLDVCSSPELAD